jgi:hypothetical protein
LKKEDKKKEEIIKDTVHTEPPYNENTPCINFNEGSIVLIWDNIKGKPIYEKKYNNSWLGPYIINKNSFALSIVIAA